MSDSQAPREYISFSQYSTYQRSPENYFKEYILGMRREPTKPMTLGKIFDEAFSNRDVKWKPQLKSFGFEKYIPIFERALSVMTEAPKNQCQFKVLADNKPLLLYSIYDVYYPTLFHIIEIKFGEREHTQESADTMEQLSFYDLSHTLKFRVPPTRMSLVWVNSKTGDVKMFKTKRSANQRKLFKSSVDYVSECIIAGKWQS